MAGYAAKLKEKTAQVGLLLSKVQNGFEMRQVPCKEVHDFKTGTVVITRTDTNEEIESREMTEDEKQGKMFDDLDKEQATGEAQK
jgi:hypothetical protein